MPLADEIKQLHELREQGVLTDAEFEEAKAGLLRSSQGTFSGPKLTDLTTDQWAVLLHLSQYLGYVVPFAGFAVPVAIWLLKKESAEELDDHGKIVVNWLLSSLVYAVICGLLTCIVIGYVGLAVLLVLAVLFPVIGAVKANQGIAWDYPLTIRFFR